MNALSNASGSPRTFRGSPARGVTASVDQTDAHCARLERVVCVRSPASLPGPNADWPGKAGIGMEQAAGIAPEVAITQVVSVQCSCVNAVTPVSTWSAMTRHRWSLSQTGTASRLQSRTPSWIWLVAADSRDADWRRDELNPRRERGVSGSDLARSPTETVPTQVAPADSRSRRRRLATAEDRRRRLRTRTPLTADN